MGGFQRIPGVTVSHSDCSFSEIIILLGLSYLFYYVSVQKFHYVLSLFLIPAVKCANQKDVYNILCSIQMASITLTICLVFSRMPI